jgi:hypothetical protein
MLSPDDIYIAARMKGHFFRVRINIETLCEAVNSIGDWVICQSWAFENLLKVRFYHHVFAPNVVTNLLTNLPG